VSYVIIPLQPVANQQASAILDGKLAQMTVWTTDYGTFMDCLYDGVPVFTGRACLDRTDINAARYNGLPQFLGFVDTQGASDPTFDGFNSRYLLVYGNPSSTATTIG
jgi:hypothetical protein